MLDLVARSSLKKEQSVVTHVFLNGPSIINVGRYIVIFMVMKLIIVHLDFSATEMLIDELRRP